MKKVRVRYAPSPTGSLHVGGVRTFLFNWLFAQKEKGTLVLRIDDTDRQRSLPVFEKDVLRDLEALGFHYEEGVLSDGSQQGAYGPYRQSERLAFYTQYAKKLLQEKKAYYCFCSPELITQKRALAMKTGKAYQYDGTCKHLSSQEVQNRFAQGRAASLRFWAPEKEIIIDDLIRGKVIFHAGTIGDFLITRTPKAQEEVETGIGMPVYNFSSILDDCSMHITHVLRGEDHLANTARQVMILEALGWKAPLFAHLPMVLGKDHQKLSKRSGDVGVSDYLEKGYLPSVLLNFLALLGWTPPSGVSKKSHHPEIITLSEMVQCFEVEKVHKSAAIFDLTKLQWMNRFYLHHLGSEALKQKWKPFLKKDPDTQASFGALSFEAQEKLLEVLKPEATFLTDFNFLVRAFLTQTVPSSKDEIKAFFKKHTQAKELISFVTSFLEALGAKEKMNSFSEKERFVNEMLSQGRKTFKMPPKEFFMGLRFFLTGKTTGSELKWICTLTPIEVLKNRFQYIQTCL